MRRRPPLGRRSVTYLVMLVGFALVFVFLDRADLGIQIVGRFLAVSAFTLGSPRWSASPDAPEEAAPSGHRTPPRRRGRMFAAAATRARPPTHECGGAMQKRSHRRYGRQHRAGGRALTPAVTGSDLAVAVIVGCRRERTASMISMPCRYVEVVPGRWLSLLSQGRP